MTENEHKPPTSAEELLERYAAGDRFFMCANLQRADLSGVTLHGAYLRAARLQGANLKGANLLNVNLMEADLDGADLTGAGLSGVTLGCAGFREATMTGVRIESTTFSRTLLAGARFGGGALSVSTFHETDLSPLCDADPLIVHEGPSGIDAASVALSLRSPYLAGFLQRSGMHEVVAEYMVDCARALDGSVIKKLLQSTFISYGGPDEGLARKLYEALHRNGVTTFFFPEHAKPGRRIGRMVRENVESYDRILLLCSKASMDRPGVLYEIQETLERERRDGGAEYLIPVELDDCLRVEGAVLRKDLVRVLRDRVCADFRGAQEDEAVFQAGLRKLIAALRPPDVALWRPPGPTTPTEP